MKRNKKIIRLAIRNSIFLLLSALLLLCTASVSNAQNYGYIHRDSILKSVPSYIPKLQELSSDQKKYSAEIKQGMEELQKKVSELLEPYQPNQQESIVGIKSRMNAMDTIKLNLLLDEEKSLKKKEESYNYMLNFTYRNEIQPIVDRVNTAISNYAKKNKLDGVYILENISSSLAYINKERIVTQAIISSLQKQENG